MSVSRWKVMACTLGLSLGGLAISAGQSNDRPNTTATPALRAAQATEPPPIQVPDPAKPSVPATAPQTLPPLQLPTPPAREIEFEIPNVIPVQAATPPVPVLDVPVVVVKTAEMHEKLPMPRELTLPALTVDLPGVLEVPMTAAPEPPAVPQAPVTPPSVKAAPMPPPVLVDNPPAPRSTPLVTPLPPVPPQASPPLPPPDLRPQPQPQPPVAVPTTKLKMLLRLGDGKPRFEIRTSDNVEMLLKVYGEKVEMQSAPEGMKASPIAGITAIGGVRFTGPGIEGTCDHLMVLSGTGEVMLKGNVHVKTKRGKTWSEMTTEKMIYQIGAASLTTPTALPPVTPAYYQQSP